MHTVCRAEYHQQQPEHKMEKMRYYVSLPGDIWEDGTFMDLIKANQRVRGADGGEPFTHALQKIPDQSDQYQVFTELVVLDKNDT